MISASGPSMSSQLNASIPLPAACRRVWKGKCALRGKIEGPSRTQMESQKSEESCEEKYTSHGKSTRCEVEV